MMSREADRVLAITKIPPSVLIGDVVPAVFMKRVVAS